MVRSPPLHFSILVLRFLGRLVGGFGGSQSSFSCVFLFWFGALRVGWLALSVVCGLFSLLLSVLVLRFLGRPLGGFGGLRSSFFECFLFWVGAFWVGWLVFFVFLVVLVLFLRIMRAAWHVLSNGYKTLSFVRNP